MDTILVVDDEPPLTELWRIVLEDCGYRVLVAHDGEEAVRRYEDDRESISAVLLDLRLPKMDGVAVCLKLKELNPKVKVLITSGNPDPIALASIKRLEGMGLLQKPFMPDDLVARLDALLHPPPAGA